MPRSTPDIPDPGPGPETDTDSGPETDTAAAALAGVGDGASYPCRELVERITEYLEDALDERERAAVDEHLELCDGCRNYVEHVRIVIRASARPDEPRRLDEVDSGIVEIFREWARTKRPE